MAELIEPPVLSVYIYPCEGSYSIASHFKPTTDASEQSICSEGKFVFDDSYSNRGHCLSCNREFTGYQIRLFEI